MVPLEFLGPYRIIEPIGKGGMGTVYRGVHEKTGHPVAVKLIAAHVADDTRFRKRFAGEVETLKRLKHRNIVTLIGQGAEAGRLFYSMELVQGESLQQLLRREKRLGWSKVLDMAIDICSALKHAHDFGVIHRDLKPANLLIDESGTVKLVDFGIAKLFGSDDQTAVGSVLGTADFMAPEQADGGPITPRTDLYALGNVMYACFAGRPPFAGRTLTNVIHSLRQESPARIDLINPDLPPEIAELIHDLLEKRPEDRPPTALAVMNRMKAIRAGLNRMATRLQDDTETVGAPSPPPEGDLTIHAPDRPTSHSSLEEKTIRRLADADVTTPSSSGGSDQLTVEATVPSALAGAAPRTRQAVREADRASEGTHFRTIEDRDRHRSLLSPERDEEPAGGMRQALPIAAMVAALLLGIAVIIYAVQRPSADRLYASIIEAQERDDSDTFRARVDQFMRLYPEDPRVDELSEELRGLDVPRVLRRLRVAAARLGGIDQLAPEEEAFVETMKDRQRDPAGTRIRLHHWLNIYGRGGQNAALSGRSVPQQMLVRAAQVELERLQDMEGPPRDERADELLERIRWGRENLSALDEQKLLEGIVSLFAEKPWAEPAVKEAQRRLAEVRE